MHFFYAPRFPSGTMWEACGDHDHWTTPTRLLFCHDRLATNGWALGVITFIGDPCESLLTVESPSLQAPAPALSSLSKEAQEQQCNDEGGPAIGMLALMDIFSGDAYPK